MPSPDEGTMISDGQYKKLQQIINQPGFLNTKLVYSGIEAICRPMLVAMKSPDKQTTIFEIELKTPLIPHSAVNRVIMTICL